MTTEKENSSLASSVIWTPTTIQEALAKKKEFGADACFISGGTLLQLQWENGNKVPKHLISLQLIQKMQGIEVERDHDCKVLSIGALSTLATCQNHSLVTMERKLLSEAVKHIAAPAVRNQATIGGNIAGRSGDVIPALLVMDAEVSLCNKVSSLKKSVWSWLKDKEDQQDDLLTQVHLPINEQERNMHYFYKKIGRREAFTAAIVTVAGSMSLNELGELDHVRLAVGGGDNLPHRLEATERLFKGEKLSTVTWKEVYSSILKEFLPTTDAFLSADYRKKVAAHIIISELQELVFPSLK
ncbi:hypothetical protein AWH48_12860 [Domibacillus aminovorans]|uniref:FAD-binding PCMH-type domain-containing protein n=1 Tax=Domibacillus aminovorans TaxID=29332 RepID=A0A177KJT1_9BACI|nr:FAD binding domain-containing protein [Domibacillus aminovorans]OAH53236.1 hypothetical protein AWH48_12860 [Domibacillus aminovorans]